MRLPAAALMVLSFACNPAPTPVSPTSPATPPQAAPPPASPTTPEQNTSQLEDPPPAPEPGAKPPGMPGPYDAAVPDVREATFRYMFKKNASGQQQKAHVYCIAFDAQDPPPEFVARLADVRPVVKPVSACDHSQNGVFDKATKQSGLVFRVGDVTWQDADHAEIGGGYYEAGLSASGNTYDLERRSGVWVVVKDLMNWISEIQLTPRPSSPA